MANQLSSLINGRYVVDVNSSWLCFDLRMLRPQSFTDTDKLNARIDEVRGILDADPNHHHWLPCLGLLERQWADINQAYKEILNEKVYILLYKSGWENGVEWPDIPVYHVVDFVCVPISGKPESEWPVFTHWNTNELAYRFKSVPVPEEEPLAPPAVEPVSPAINVRLECLKLVCDITDLNAFSSDSILQVADKFVDWVNGV